MAVEWRHGQKIEGAKQNIQHEQNAQKGGRKFRRASRDRRRYMREACLLWDPEISEYDSEVNARRRQPRQREVCHRSCERHPGGAMRISLRPVGIVGRAGPAEHPVRRQKLGDPRDDDRAEWFPLNMRQGIQAHLAAMKRRRIVAKMRHQRVRALMARGGKQKHDVPDDANDYELRTERLRIHALAQSKWRARVVQAVQLDFNKTNRSIAVRGISSLNPVPSAIGVLLTFSTSARPT